MIKRRYNCELLIQPVAGCTFNRYAGCWNLWSRFYSVNDWLIFQCS